MPSVPITADDEVEGVLAADQKRVQCDNAFDRYNALATQAGTDRTAARQKERRVVTLVLARNGQTLPPGTPFTVKDNGDGTATVTF
jgi:hypothetical protein